MRKEDFLTLAEVVAIHDAEIAARGGTQGVRSRDLLESAVAAPQASFDGEYLNSTVWEVAAAYTFHLSENQPFLDGNKRTALATGLSFLRLYGFYVPASYDNVLYDFMIGFAKRGDKHEMAKWLARVSGRVKD
jgi:death-on-curing protein